MLINLVIYWVIHFRNEPNKHNLAAKLQIFFHSRNFFGVFFLFLHFFLYFCSQI